MECLHSKTARCRRAFEVCCLRAASSVEVYSSLFILLSWFLRCYKNAATKNGEGMPLPPHSPRTLPRKNAGTSAISIPSREASSCQRPSRLQNQREIATKPGGCVAESASLRFRSGFPHPENRGQTFKRKRPLLLTAELAEGSPRVQGAGASESTCSNEFNTGSNAMCQQQPNSGVECVS